MYKLIIFIICYFIYATIMITVGIVDFNRTMPATFYIGEKELKADEVPNVKKWNMIHGIMSIISSMITIPFWVTGYLIENNFCGFLCFLVGVVIPFTIMAVCHYYILKRFRNNKILNS